ncbi:hypothetical protein CEK26_009224 [Fusarium fujikuroi]|nr:hypothetical protein CEK27_009244 [Fusarium fujikuroi]QGI82522.1 hypothetical protein CEK25_009251 [Fusarium fujikuroi]QGI96155.1 hypothetical protein CEK26_009224 [Fusarium fujikuroi]
MAQPVVDNQHYPSWINNNVFRQARFQGDPQYNRSHWAEAEVEGVKFRITRGKETDFRFRDVPIDIETRPNEEFVHRCENDVLEDENLNNASLAAVREYFRTWNPSKGCKSDVGNTRYVACIMLDAETLSQIATAPKGFPHGFGVYSSSSWVKMVDVEPTPDEAVYVRVRGADDLIKYWFIRNLIRSHVLTHRKDRDYPGVLHFGDPPSEGFEAFGGPPLSLF